MNELPFIESSEQFLLELRRLELFRNDGKIKDGRKTRIALSQKERLIIFEKTAGKCHVCSRDLLIEKFEADHVKSHSSGGTSKTDNYLPACRTCNNYRWNYLPEEFQWVLKLGIWAKTEILRNGELGKMIGREFVKREKTREGRRKSPRTIE